MSDQLKRLGPFQMSKEAHTPPKVVFPYLNEHALHFDDLKFLKCDPFVVHSKKILQISSIEILECITMHFQIECTIVKFIPPSLEDMTHEVAR